MRIVATDWQSLWKFYFPFKSCSYRGKSSHNFWLISCLMHIYSFYLAYNANNLPGLKCIAFENWKLAWLIVSLMWDYSARSWCLIQLTELNFTEVCKQTCFYDMNFLLISISISEWFSLWRIHFERYETRDDKHSWEFCCLHLQGRRAEWEK